MQDLLSDSEYCQFDLVGSGVQWKVDRLTLGVQTVCQHVHPDLSTRYQSEIRERMHRVDPNGQVCFLRKFIGNHNVSSQNEKTVLEKSGVM